MKIHVITGSQVCAYTRTLQEFLCFCCHKRYNALHKTLYISIYNRFFNKLPILFSQNRQDDIGKREFSRRFFSEIILHFPALSHTPLFSPQVWHFWQQNKQHYGWNARAYAYEQGRLSEFTLHCFPHFPFFLRFPFLLFWGGVLLHSQYLCFDICTLYFRCYTKKKMHFSAIYHALGPYLPIYK